MGVSSVELSRMDCRISIGVDVSGSTVTLSPVNSEKNCNLVFFKKYTSSRINDEIPCGEYKLTIEKDGYSPINDEISIESNRFTKNYILQSL